MARLQNSDSQKRYAGYMKRFICYLLRVHEAQQSGGDGDESDSFYSQLGQGGDSNSDSGIQSGDRKDSMRDAKRLFPWSSNQKQLTQAFVTALHLDPEEAQIACLLRLLEGFIFQTTGDEPFETITIGREVVSKEFGEGTQEALTEGDLEEPEQQLESGLDLQAGRSELTGTLRYGVEMGIVSHLSHRSVQVFRDLSSKWHRFLQLSSTLPNPLTPVSVAKAAGGSRQNQGPPAKSLPAQPAQDQAEPAIVNDSKIQILVQKVVQKEAPITFKSSEQEIALRAILAGETPLVVVLPTGGGKSLLFMAPACLSDPGVTIVVVPFRELLKNLKTRLAEAKIPATEWIPGLSANGPAPIILVSADAAGSFEFLTFATLLMQGGWLRRIVVDECHLTYTSSDWRPKLAHLARLRAIKAQFILLTATQPPLLEYELGAAMALRSPRYIRAPTLRPNIRYLVQRCQPGGLLKAAQGVATRWLAGLSGKQKAVIYCKYKDTCEKLAQQLECDYYHAGLDADDRSRVLKAWLQRGGLITATSSLGTGVDYPEIVGVLHVDTPYGAMDFAQESGRAGREGQLVDSVILVESPRQKAPALDIPVDHSWRALDEAAIQEFINPRLGACRRSILSSFLDVQNSPMFLNRTPKKKPGSETPCKR
ncbi:unnamed protein product [Alternaria alternata]